MQRPGTQGAGSPTGPPTLSGAGWAEGLLAGTSLRWAQRGRAGRTGKGRGQVKRAGAATHATGAYGTCGQQRTRAAEHGRADTCTRARVGRLSLWCVPHGAPGWAGPIVVGRRAAWWAGAWQQKNDTGSQSILQSPAGIVLLFTSARRSASRPVVQPPGCCCCWCGAAPAAPAAPLLPLPAVTAAPPPTAVCCCSASSRMRAMNSAFTSWQACDSGPSISATVMPAPRSVATPADDTSGLGSPTPTTTCGSVWPTAGEGQGGCKWVGHAAAAAGRDARPQSTPSVVRVDHRAGQAGNHTSPGGPRGGIDLAAWQLATRQPLQPFPGVPPPTPLPTRVHHAPQHHAHSPGPRPLPPRHGCRAGCGRSGCRAPG